MDISLDLCRTSSRAEHSRAAERERVGARMQRSYIGIDPGPCIIIPVPVPVLYLRTFTVQSIFFYCNTEVQVKWIISVNVRLTVRQEESQSPS